jgi:hypothetical protein
MMPGTGGVKSRKISNYPRHRSPVPSPSAALNENTSSMLAQGGQNRVSGRVADEIS